VKTTGDGILIEFSSVVDAVRCAVEMQQGMALRSSDLPSDMRIDFRMGIHLGDVVVEGDDLLGDGVNVAARLEGIAEPGAICLSADAHRQVKGKIDLAMRDLGEQHLKNIAEPVRVYRVLLDAGARKFSAALTLPDKPSIAVLPFQNMSGDPEQEYFADGIVEDIITALSRFRQLFVIARNSSFTYKGRAIDVKQVGRELGVRYVLEGSVRKAANRVRITGQLIDSVTGGHLWADRFDGPLDDVFDLQDRVAASVVATVGVKVEHAEMERAKRKPTESLDAYDCLLRGQALGFQWRRETNDEALQLFYRAIELDPGFALAYALAAWCYGQRKANGLVMDRAKERFETERLARRAAELGKDDAAVLSLAGWALAFVVNDIDTAAAMADHAISLNPNLAVAWVAGAWVKVYLCEPDAAIERVAHAMRLSPLDPRLSNMQCVIAWAHFIACRHDEAAQWAGRALLGLPNYAGALRVAVAAHALADRLDAARAVLARLCEVDPTFRVSNFDDRMFFIRQPEVRARFVDGLRRAGLPEA